MDGQSRKVITSWADVIGAASRWINFRVNYYSTFAWKRRRGLEKQSGKTFPQFGLVQIYRPLAGILYEHLRRCGRGSELSYGRGGAHYP
jgi:hypothetical protein